MKKTYVVVLVVLLCIVGCKSSKNYEFHYYDEKSNKSNHLVAKYDDFGRLSSLEWWIIYNDRNTCEGFINNIIDVEDLNYVDVRATCEVLESGIKTYFIMTNKSVENGYLKDGKKFSFAFSSFYEYFNTEENALFYLEELKDNMKDENIVNNDDNYIIIKGKKVSW